MRAFYIWGTLVTCLSIVNRDDFEPLAISDERFLKTRDADALSNDEDFSPITAIGVGARGGGRGGGGGSSGSAGRGGERGGSKGGKGSDGAKGSNGYGKTSRPDRSEDSNPPPPYSKGDNAPPPPYSPGSYGQRGPSRSYWNGQYYPYGAYGYGGFFPFLGFGAAPFLLAGPFGLYGHYCGGSRSENCTVKNYYVNGTRNDTSSSEINLVNGTYYEIVWQDSTYELRSQGGGVYMNAQILDSDENIAVNGTYASNSPSWETKTINPNVTSNGTTLESSDNSGPASLEIPSIYVSVGAIVVTALLI